SCFNGSSEMVSQLATAVTTFLFNRTMMNLLGENGVAAITIIIYSQFLLNTLYIGYSMGIAPIIGFNYGNRNAVRQRRVFSISMGFIGLASVLIFAVSMLGGSYIVRLFADETSEVYRIAASGFTIFSYSFLFCGLNNFTSAMFTVLSNGKVSAVLSFLRTFGLLAGGILLLPRIWGITGVWLAVPAAEGIMFVVSAACLFHYRKRYCY
ncbi:MATE family efflux transporter, partial [uncultured Oscillibacter sp.]